MAKRSKQSVDQNNVTDANVQNDEQRTRDIEKLLTALRHDDTTSRDKKTIRRVLRDKYNYYISQNRTNATNELIDRILSE